MGRQRWSLQGSCCQLGPNRQALSSSCLCRWFLSNSKGRDSIAVLAADPPIRPSLVGHFLVPRQSIWMAEHQPCSHSVLNLHGQGRDAPTAGGCANLAPHFLHVCSALFFPCHLCAGQDSGNSVPGSLQSSLYPLLCQRPHRDYCRECNSPTAISILLPHWPLSFFCKVDPEPFNVFGGLKPAKVVSDASYPAKATFLP